MKKPIINVDEVMRSMGERLSARKKPAYIVDHEMGSSMTKEEIAEFHRKLEEARAQGKLSRS